MKSLLDYFYNSGQLNTPPEDKYLEKPMPTLNPGGSSLDYLQKSPGGGSAPPPVPPPPAESPSAGTFNTGIQKALEAAKASNDLSPRARLQVDPEQRHRAFRRAMQAASQHYAQPTPDNMREPKGFFQKAAAVSRSIGAGMSAHDDETERNTASNREIERENYARDQQSWKNAFQERKAARDQANFEMRHAADLNRHKMALEAKKLTGAAKSTQAEEEFRMKKELHELKKKKIDYTTGGKEKGERARAHHDLMSAIDEGIVILDKYGDETEADLPQKYLGKDHPLITTFDPMSAPALKMDAIAGTLKAHVFKNSRYRSNNEFNSIITPSSKYSPEVNREILQTVKDINQLWEASDKSIASEKRIIGGGMGKLYENTGLGSSEEAINKAIDIGDDGSQSGGDEDTVRMKAPNGEEFNVPKDDAESYRKKYELTEV